MTIDQIRIYAATGALGMGFLDSSLERATDWSPHMIGCDAGSTDSGPTHLGASKPKMSEAAIRRDLSRLLKARDRLKIPLIIGSCGTSGTDIGVNWMRRITEELAIELELSFRMTMIYTEQKPEKMERAWNEGKIHALPGAPIISAETFRECSHIVAMAGAEVYQKALQDGADVILAGRSSDTAIYAALPLIHGFPPGPVWHCAKTIECGAVCSTKMRADGMMGYIDHDGFIIEPAALDAAATPLGIASHTLYENADPFLITEPSGVLDTSDATYKPYGNRSTRVEGMKFEHRPYTIKLEGAIKTGYQSVAIGGVRDPLIIKQMNHWQTEMMEQFADRASELFDLSLGDDLHIEIKNYGQNAVMGSQETNSVDAHEVGLLFVVTAPTQKLANDVARFVVHLASHWPIPEWDGFISGIAFPFSPPEIDRGPAYRFALNHVIVPKDPFELFGFETVEVGA
ncbi:MAG: acyclic terpene utilization AtuA family protein [Desulfobulbia bacterium]